MTTSFDCYSCKTLKILHELLVLVLVCLTLCFVLCQDKETGFHRGFCWVGFSSEEGLNNALQKDLHMIEGAKVKRNVSLSPLKRALRTLFVYTEFTKKRVFELLTLAVACSTSRRPASWEVSISECDVTWRTVKVDGSESLVPYKCTDNLLFCR